MFKKNVKYLDTDNVDTLKARVQDLEGKALVKTISLFASNDIGPLSDLHTSKNMESIWGKFLVNKIIK